MSLISLFNAGGRFLWASGSDYIGRRNTYLIFFAVQVGLFLLIPRLAAGGQWWLFQVSLFVVFTMYGGGFATIPAFLADIFGAQNVGAIHGALLTAWSWRRSPARSSSPSCPTAPGRGWRPARTC